MKLEICYTLHLGVIWLITTRSLFGQVNKNCFLDDFEPKIATIPLYVDSAKTTQTPNVTLTINPDTLGKVSNYILGNAVAVWVGPNQNNPTLVSHLQKTAPTLIPFPDGSWSNIYFRNRFPSNVPDTLLDSYTGAPYRFWPQNGANFSLTLVNIIVYATRLALKD